MANSSVELEIAGPYWITRNRTMGVLEDTVEVWLTKPDLRRFDDGDVMWLPNLQSMDSEVSYFAEWTLDQCRRRCLVVPETERECIRVG